VAVGLVGCDPYGSWVDPHYPWVVSDEWAVQPYEEVRWETETWDPYEDLEVTALYLLKAANHRKGAPPESLDHFAQMKAEIPALSSEDLTLSLVGDIMWVGGGWSALASPVGHVVDGDLALGNLETPTSPDHPTGLGALGTYQFNAPPELLDSLPFDVLQLNNNHSLDAGDEGLEATVEQVRSRGMEVVGVDEHLSLESAGVQIEVLSYTWGLNEREAQSSHELFIVPFGHIGQPISLEGVGQDISAARQRGADIVIVMPHWGFEYEYYPDPHFMVLARELVAMGADVVAGSGPHVVQPPEICHVNRPEEVPGVGVCSVRNEDGRSRTAAVFYSLGNFGTAMATLPCQVGLVASVSVNPQEGVTGLGWDAVASVKDGGGQVLVPLETLVDDPDYGIEMDRLQQHLGRSWQRESRDRRGSR